MSRKKRALTAVDELEVQGLAKHDDLPQLRRVAESFRVRITPAMQQRVAPIAAQFVPDERELIVRSDELHDPIGDEAHSPVPGLTHRYPDRAIMHVTQTCDVYCRFCFRREVVGAAGPLPRSELDAALAYIERTPALREIILTGGDPMTLSARRIGEILDRVEQIEHVEVIRFHSRVPVVSPERIADLAPALKRQKAIYVVIHTNHADELTPEARTAIRLLADSGVALLSQTVLLRGVNDDVETLARLFRSLTALRVTPYYLHHCDLARGTSHFRTTIDEGLALVAALRGHLSGVAMPRYVLDLPGGFGKVPLDSEAVTKLGAGRWKIRDWRGQVHNYRDVDR
ncbi:lysine-2,3-aminomutase-like protein [Paracoccus albus]|uniref:lysine-2,3-aminomutase-like protein n=1 Tax=Paracoccus albus TaxID=3017784 RepID=UPI0022F0F92A|nr:lysine-2,3-aminomutase-like protein [Paracoccus albus]WBU61137.1 lysine-2,3-aminomutase-like protein [Paracoccus albus]